MPSREELGKRLKSVRLSKGLTLKEVELLSGVSMTHTSQIERGMTSPTIGALEKLARALDKTASYFIEENALEEICRVCRGERSVLSNEEHGVRFESLSNGIPGGALHFYHLFAEPGGKPPAPRTHVGEEALMVLKGNLDVTIGDEEYRLKAGDSIHFKSDKPHYFLAPNKHGAEAIWVGTAVPLL